MTTGRYTKLEPLGPHRVQAVAGLAMSMASSGRWRLGNSSGGDEVLGRVLSAGIVRQRIIVSRESGELVGLCQLINADWRAGRAELTVLIGPQYWMRSWPMEGVGLFIQDCFEQTPLRKLCASVTPEVLQAIRSGIDRYFSVDGVQRQREYINGEYVDLTLLSFDRSAWPFERIHRFVSR